MVPTCSLPIASSTLWLIMFRPDAVLIDLIFLPAPFVMSGKQGERGEGAP